MNESGFKQQIDLLEFSGELNQRIYGLIDLVEVMEPGQDVSTIQAAICEYYESNKIGLDGDDLVYFGAMVDVAMKSAEIWLDNDMGGQGLFAQFQNKRSELCTEWLENRWIGGVILADATGLVSGAAASVVSSGGAAAVPNPALGGLPTASVVGVVTGAAASVNKAW
ncbi:MAG: hypothetical protein GVY26_09210 [Bacteroidetes bacterium]|nr:hypothetical protein [Bacteroidota bacterium]